MGKLKMTLKKIVSFFTLVFVFSSLAYSNVITFDSYSNQHFGSNTLTTQDFDFTAGLMYTYKNNNYGYSTASEGDGTQIDSTYLMFQQGFNSVYTSLVMERNDNSTFILNSLDASAWYNSTRLPTQNYTFTATGKKNDNSSVVSVFQMDNINDGIGGGADFETFTFGNEFQNLKSVTFDFSLSDSTWQYLAFDNITVNATVPSVSAPSVIVLIAICAFALLSRKRLG